MHGLAVGGECTTMDPACGVCTRLWGGLPKCVALGGCIGVMHCGGCTMTCRAAVATLATVWTLALGGPNGGTGGENPGVAGSVALFTGTGRFETPTSKAATFRGNHTVTGPTSSAACFGDEDRAGVSTRLATCIGDEDRRGVSTRFATCFGDEDPAGVSTRFATCGGDDDRAGVSA